MYLGNLSVVGSTELAAMNRVIADLLDNPQGQVPDKYDVKEVIKQTQSFMDTQIRAHFPQLLRTFSDVFSKSEWDIGRRDLVQHKIDLYPGSKPVNLPPRRMPMHFENDLRQKIDKFLEHKLITPCHCPYSSPAMLVPKKNDKLPLVIDYRQLNKQTVNSCWPLPSVEKVFDTLEESCYFSTIDMSWGFYQLFLESRLYRIQYSVWFFQMVCYANGSHRQSCSFPISDGKSLSRPFVAKHNSVLR